MGMLFVKRPSSWAAMTSMVVGGTVTLSLIVLDVSMPYGLDAIFYGITLSFISFIAVQYLSKRSSWLS